MNEKYLQQISVGEALVRAVCEFAIACISHNVTFTPQELLDIIRNKHGKLSQTRKYLKNSESRDTIETAIAQQHHLQSDSKRSKYQEYVLNSGITYKQLIAMCFKISENDFEVKTQPGRVEIIPKSDNQDEFLKLYHAKMSHKLSDIDREFQRNKKHALEKRSALLEISRTTEAMHVVQYNDIKKESFIV